MTSGGKNFDDFPEN